MSFVSMNGQLVPAEQATVSVQDRSFRYGDGVFETIEIFQYVPYQWEFHIERLSKGLGAIFLFLDVNPLATWARALIQANKVQSGILRLHVSRGSGSAGYLPKDEKPMVVMETHSQKLPLPNQVALWVSDFEKPAAKALPAGIKHASALNSVLARIEAQSKDCFDALLLNAQGYICETSSANIFWLHDGTLHTPALSCGCLEGSRRARILALSPYPMQQVTSTIKDILMAEAVVVSNAARGVVPVDCIRPYNSKWNSVALANHLNGIITKDMYSYNQARAKDWHA
jgi:branched-chain amino acid aminotransferase